MPIRTCMVGGPFMARTSGAHGKIFHSGLVAGVVLVFLVAMTTYSLAAARATPSPVSHGQDALLYNNTTVVNVAGTDQFAWVPSVLSAQSLHVEFVVTNAGTISHTFTLSDRVNVTAPPNATSSTAPGQWFETSHLYANEPLNASTSAGPTVLHVFVNFTAIGFYQFICIPHYALGMKGIIYVGVPVPSSTTPVAPPIEGFWVIVIVIAALASLTVILGFVVGKRSAPHAGRTHDKTPETALTSTVEYYNDSRPTPMESPDAPQSGGPDVGNSSPPRAP